MNNDSLWNTMIDFNKEQRAFNAQTKHEDFKRKINERPRRKKKRKK